MKIIDFLKQIEEEGKFPKKIKVYEEIYTYDEDDGAYYRPSYAELGEIDKPYQELFEDDYDIYISLNVDVKIIEEQSSNTCQFDDVEEIKHRYIYGLNEKEEAIDDRVSEIEDKLNEVIRKLNKGKSE